MATFGKTTFNTARYAAARPTYPRQLYDFIFKYHESKLGAKWERAVDLGCGTGQATTELTPFRHIIGVDPSAKMIDQARASISALPPDAKLLQGTKVEFVQSAAEDLKFLGDGSVDLLVAAQACHWFDWNRMWPEAKRVLRKGGSVAFWGYSEFRLSHHPRLTPLIHAYAQGSDPATSLGPHWEQPGRRIVDGHLMGVPEPWVVTGAGEKGEGEGEGWEDFRRVFWVGSHHPSLPTPHLPILLRKRMSWSSLLDYLGSFSSLHTFKQRYPEDEGKEGGGIERRFLGVLREGVREDLEREGGQGEGEGEGEGEEVDVEWPMAVILVRRA
ncbi:S-adenosyl-L-methionine-dependent methyltransferase [Stereum hirsutum FP-91666 SS1]|uniref:S-adenosyl-L-methionine-dependent methyltransferase n=1 Tax=Stereum hirsutum (strain FP-91666) TaxID=721885 RepID=UPI000444A4EA|nr:S-adenosyl-L-methionine-dependent methyltransferase [Stereum hirsutum FP-91666 SS1]EIM83771.1 S-adenosyl-L-methionine-dependent methyltransferase [Stereum hirsutum FP-91666 SS1]